MAVLSWQSDMPQIWLMLAFYGVTGGAEEIEVQINSINKGVNKRGLLMRLNLVLVILTIKMSILILGGPNSTGTSQRV